MVGFQEALKLILPGKAVNPTKAKRLGIVHTLLPVRAASAVWLVPIVEWPDAPRVLACRRPLNVVARRDAPLSLFAGGHAHRLCGALGTYVRFRDVLASSAIRHVLPRGSHQSVCLKGAPRERCGRECVCRVRHAGMVRTVSWLKHAAL